MSIATLPSLCWERLTQELHHHGFSIQTQAIPEALVHALYAHQQGMRDSLFNDAGVGRGEDFQHEEAIRTDEICWIDGNSEAGAAWLAWAEALKTHLNRHLFLGLFSFESHFAHYRSGDYYKRHVDAFRGEANRVLSVVLYLNRDWQPGDGGELVLYQSDEDLEGITVPPLFGTLVVFLSEAFPHEVLPARADRYSIAGWFRVNSSVTERVDPPR